MCDLENSPKQKSNPIARAKKSKKKLQVAVEIDIT